MPVDPVVTRRFIESLSTHLEDHLATWKSQLVDAKRDVENILTVISERIPAQARPLFPEDLMAMILEDALPPPPPPQKVVERVVEKVVETVTVPGPPSPPDWAVVRGAFTAVESSRTQVDLLTRFLQQATVHASRAALLVLRNDRLTGWKAHGFDASGGRDDAAKSIDLAADADPFAAEVLKVERSMLCEPPDESWPLRHALGGAAPSRSLLVPMVIRDRIAGLVWADELPGEEGRLNEAAIEVLTFVAGLTVDLLAARKKIPSPTLTPTGESIPKFRTAPPPAVDPAATMRAPALDVPPAPAPATEESETAARRKVTDAQEAIRALEESSSYNKKRERAARSIEELGFGSSVPSPRVPPTTPIPTGEVTLAFEHLKTAPAPREAEPQPPAPPVVPLRESSAPKSIPTPAQPMQESLAALGSAPMAPPVGFIPRARAAGRGDDQQRAVDDAKRLARLLVSEIKLYNERKVEEGRAAGDLYERLRDDIQRSRQVYEERTPEAIRSSSDFFHEELVRILAEGRPEALGPVN